MQRTWLTVFLLTLTLLISSCGNDSSTQTETPKETPKAQTTPNPNPPEPDPSSTNENKEAEKKDSPVASGLIPSIDPDDRLDVVKVRQGRNDPFSPIKVNTKIEAAPSNIIPPPNPTGQIPLPITNNNSDVNSSPDGSTENPENVIPQPDLANEVEVTGIIELGNQIQVIVNAPQEPFSRYVEPGQFLSNGQVLVKRVETQIDGSKIVILEQFGQEVIKTIEFSG